MQYKSGGTEIIVDCLSKYFSKKHTIFTWIPDLDQDSNKIFLSGKTLPSFLTPDVFIVHCGILQLQDYAFLNLFNFNIPIICILHRMEPVQFINGVYYITVSNAVNRIQNFPCQTIYNPIRFFSYDSHKTNINFTAKRKKLTIARHCRFSMEKNWSDFFRIADPILKKFPYVNVAILGKQTGIVNNIITSWANGKNVKIYNWNDKEEDVASFLNNCDIYLETSIKESFCMGVAEAAMYKKPIVCLTSPATDELFGDLTVYDSVEAIKLIETLIIDEDIRNKYGEKCYERIPKQDIFTFGKKYEEFIKYCICDYKNKTKKLRNTYDNYKQ